MTPSVGTTALSSNDFRLIPPALGCWAITAVALLLPSPVTLWLVIGCVALCVMFVGRAVVVAERWPVTAMIIATAGLAAGVGSVLLLRIGVVEHHRLGAEIGHRTTVVVAVTDDPQWLAPNGSRLRVRVSVWAVGRDGAGHPRRVRSADAVVFVSGALRGDWAIVSPGQRLEAVVAVRAPPGHDLTVATLNATSAPTMLDAGPAYLQVSAAIRWRFAQVAQRALPSEQAGLLPGLVLGDTSGVDDAVRDDFRAASLSHLLAVSGANFALITGAAILLVAFAGAGPRTTAIIGIVVIVGFAVVVRPSPSVVRAAGMGIVGVLALMMSRRSHAMPALGTAIIVALLWWPSMALDAGFAMSVAASAALIACGGPCAEWLRAHRIPNGLAQVLAMAVIAQLATAPVVAMISGRFSVVGVLANIVVAPVLGLISVFGAIAAVAASCGPVGQICAELVIRALEPELWWMLACARTLGNQGWGAIPVPDGMVGALLVAVLSAAIAGLVRGLWQHRRGGRPLAPLARRRRLSRWTGNQFRDGPSQQRSGRAGAGHPDPGG
ncbi:putative ComEC/Rec2-related protein [Gordonia effusa NBRC 100432]|uniref:Putative ComEC/Rec2-related protein n=1 Tax=Gordonia effusa NBRC 100432 TaxID=1077974 RepID=H0QZV8_9ACTN|nr:ComEC/Rec2 family competence protein [Gordonia effusa]GAB18359.1 putative ComEC/Rec2-related protein [Gordonia effusa NBRC 100432]